MSDRLELNLTSDPCQLRTARRAVEELAHAAGFSDATCGHLVLAVNEAIANVIRHAYRNAPDRPIRLTADAADGTLTVRIRDWGPTFDPDTLPPPSAPDCPGGLGLLFIRRLMDAVTFTRLDDGMLLTMTKTLNRQRSPE